MAEPVKAAIDFQNFVVPKVEYSVSPNALAENASPDVEIAHRVDFAPDGEFDFLVVYNIKATIPKNLRLEVEAIAFFRSALPIDENIRESAIVRINAVAIGFPFLRSFIATLTANTGFPRMMLPTMNLQAVSKPLAKEPQNSIEDSPAE
ncbi:MAG: protein-export chaperone SecB [Flavobacteriales bacterium]|nr:protein-export chaperone SecB [Flavobacteriales bacterium]